MPVTAKLSRSFYETLGDDVANELVDWFNQVDATYRAELREFNELNFSRFDAKHEQRIAELEAKLGVRFAEFGADFEQRIAELEARLGVRFAEFRSEFEQRIAELEARLDVRYAEIDAQFRDLRNYVDQRFAEIDARFRELRKYVDQRFAEQNAKIEAQFQTQRSEMIKWMFVFWVGTLVPLAGLIVLLAR